MRRIIIRVALAVGAVAVVWVGWVVVSGFQSWQSVERVDFDPVTARQQLDAYRSTSTSTTTTTVPAQVLAPPLEGQPFDVMEYLESRLPPSTTTTTTAPELPAPAPSKRSSITAYLVGGSDGSPSIGNADLIMLLIDPSDAAPVVVSVPRSLYVTNPCTGQPGRLALTLQGCPGVAGGVDLFAIALEDFTGLNINHFGVIGYDGFQPMVDAAGGIEVCSDNARGQGGQVIIPAGCNLVDGTAAAWWVTNRSQDELVDGVWRAVEGDSELSRNARQRQMILKMFARLTSLSSAGSITSVLSTVSQHIVMDGSLSLGGAASIAWSMRGQSIRQIGIPTRAETLSDGRFVLYPTESFMATLARVYPPAASYQP
jgi:LCP family protein required for cell wall assembly